MLRQTLVRRLRKREAFGDLLAVLLVLNFHPHLSLFSHMALNLEASLPFFQYCQGGVPPPPPPFKALSK